MACTKDESVLDDPTNGENQPQFTETQGPYLGQFDVSGPSVTVIGTMYFTNMIGEWRNKGFYPPFSLMEE